MFTCATWRAADRCSPSESLPSRRHLTPMICTDMYMHGHASCACSRRSPTRRACASSRRSAAASSAVNDIVGRVDIHQSGVSRHLRILQEAGFVQVRPDGPKRFYSLRPEPFRELDAWVARYRNLWEARLDRFAQSSSEGRGSRRQKQGEEHVEQEGRKRHLARNGRITHRADLPGARRGRLGALDDQGRHRVLVGPGGILREGEEARSAPGRRACATR